MIGMAFVQVLVRELLMAAVTPCLLTGGFQADNPFDYLGIPEMKETRNEVD